MPDAQALNRRPGVRRTELVVVGERIVCIFDRQRTGSFHSSKIPLLIAHARINHKSNSRDGDRGFCDVGCKHDLSRFRWRWHECILLFVDGQCGIECSNQYLSSNKRDIWMSVFMLIPKVIRSGNNEYITCNDSGGCCAA